MAGNRGNRGNRVTAGQSLQKKTATYEDVAVFFHIYAGMLTLP